MKIKTEETRISTELTVELTSHEVQVLVAAGLQLALQATGNLSPKDHEAKVDLTSSGAIVTFRPKASTQE